MATQRPTLSVKPTPRHNATIEDLLPGDVADLMENPKFRRFMLTVFKDAGMYSGSFHSEVGATHFAAGRRSLGLDILRTLEEHSGADAQIRILQEAQTLKEAQHDRRNYDRSRNRELGGDDRDFDDARDGDDDVLDYGGDAAQPGG